mgnify:CR=1 FL=1
MTSTCIPFSKARYSAAVRASTGGGNTLHGGVIGKVAEQHGTVNGAGALELADKELRFLKRDADGGEHHGEVGILVPQHLGLTGDLRRQIGMIFQDHHLLMDRTVYDNVAIPLIIAGASGDDIRRRVSAALDKVGLLDKAKNFPIQLSGGEQQRVGIARAVVNKPAVLLADEPTGNLDDALSEGILRLFEEFNRVGVTVLMATHDINLISRRSYRMLTLSDGHLHGGVGHE